MENYGKRTLKTVPQRLSAAMIAAAAVLTGLATGPSAARAAEPADLWKLALDKQPVHRFSTLITASQVRDLLATDAGIDSAIEWCKATGVTKVYIETFRSKYMASKETLEHAKERFLAAGFQVSGCVTTTIVGKQSTGWNLISCYTGQATQERLQEIFEFTAGLFDEIMIDDFWFTDCACPECEAGRRAKTVKVGSAAYPVRGDTWEDYRCELMVRVSRDRILGPARKVNPNVKLIIKYPQWYDNFHERGYEGSARPPTSTDLGRHGDAITATAMGGTQYEAYFIMRWLGGIAEEMRRGWLDPSAPPRRPTSSRPGRQSCRARVGPLLRLTAGKHRAGQRTRCGRTSPNCSMWPPPPRGRRRAAYKPPNSHPEEERFRRRVRATLTRAVFDPRDLAEKLNFIASGRPVLVMAGGALKAGSGSPNVFRDPPVMLGFGALPSAICLTEAG